VLNGVEAFPKLGSTSCISLEEAIIHHIFMSQNQTTRTLIAFFEPHNPFGQQRDIFSRLYKTHSSEHFWSTHGEPPHHVILILVAHLVPIKIGPRHIHFLMSSLGQQINPHDIRRDIVKTRINNHFFCHQSTPVAM
jgi:hypothetical protein